MVNEVKKFAVRGTTDEVTECQICGRIDLRRTVVLAVLDVDGTEVDRTYAGTECAATVTRWTHREVARWAREADRAAADAARAARLAKIQAETDAEHAALLAWANDAYGMSAATISAFLYQVPRMTYGRLYTAWQDATAAPAPAPIPAGDALFGAPELFGQTVIAV